MSDERIDKLEASLQALRRQVSQMDRDRRTDRVRTGYDLAACTIAGALFVLTATAWRTAIDRSAGTTRRTPTPAPAAGWRAWPASHSR